MASSAFILLLSTYSALLLLATSARGLESDSYVRVQTDPADGSRIVTLADFERVVNFVFDAENKYGL